MPPLPPVVRGLVGEAALIVGWTQLEDEMAAWQKTQALPSAPWVAGMGSIWLQSN
jgi:hypothetical protein